MAKLSVCMETFFPETPFVERVGKIAEAGFEAVEFWFWDLFFDGRGLRPEEKALGALKEALEANDVVLTDFAVNTNEGGVGGALVTPQDRKVFLSRLAEMLDIAQQLDCGRLIVCSGNTLPDLSPKAQKESIIVTLSEAGPMAAQAGITLLLEPLNTLVDHPGYFLDSAQEGFEIIRAVNHPHVRLLYDIYHMQIMEGNIVATISENTGLIGHFHAAGVPGRHEFYPGELSYPFILSQIDKLGYEGYVGLEYFPTLESGESLRKVRQHLS